MDFFGGRSGSLGTSLSMVVSEIPGAFELSVPRVQTASDRLSKIPTLDPTFVDPKIAC